MGRVNSTNNTAGMKGTVENLVILDLEKKGVQQRLTARQGDSLVHKIVVRLTLGGMRFIPTGVALAQFYGLLGDGSTVTADGVIRPDGAVEFIPGSSFFGVGGSVMVRLVLRDGSGAELYSPAFAIDAEYCFAAGTPAVPEEEYSRIEEMLVTTLEAQKKCEAAAEEVLANAVPLSDAAPLGNGAASAGSSGEAARADHTHPTDTTRMPSADQIAVSTNPASSDCVLMYSSTEKAMKRVLFGRIKALVKDFLTTETWTFVLKDGSTVDKEVVVK